MTVTFDVTLKLILEENESAQTYRRDIENYLRHQWEHNESETISATIRSIEP